MKQLLLLSSILLLITACEKNIKVDIPQRDPRLVINAWLAKDSIIELTVGKSRNVLQAPDQTGSMQEAYLVKNAIAKVFENNVLIDTLVYNSLTMTYKSPLKRRVKAGATYSITVTAPGFAVAEGGTLVPSQSIINSVSRVREARQTADGYKQDEITIRIDDPAGEENYYLVQLFGSAFSGSQGSGIYCVSTTDKDLEPIGDNADPLSTDNCYDGTSLLMKDANFNGKQKLIRLYVDSYALMDMNAPGAAIRHPYVVVNRITADYFRFVKSYHVYYNSADNPFAEPVNVYTNIRNGYGSFSAYTRAVDTLR